MSFISRVTYPFRLILSIPTRFFIWLFNLPRRFWRWVLTLPKKISIPVGLLLVVAISFGIFHAVKFWNFMSNDPEFCNSCHIMAESWDRWATSEHADVGCHSCHHQSLAANISQLYTFIFTSPDTIQKHAEVEDDSCIVCHESNDPNWIQISNTTGHMIHAEVENEDIDCVTCHSPSVHSFASTADTCLECHTDQYVTMADMDEMHCHVCHDFTIEGEQFLPQRGTCLSCHEERATDVEWNPDAPMQLPCSDCHQPHEQTSVLVDCTQCHSVGGYHLIGSHSAMSCQTCHEAHIWNTEDRGTCLTCHPTQVEHHEPTACNTCHTYTGTTNE